MGDDIGDEITLHIFLIVVYIFICFSFLIDSFLIDKK